jgi:ubiquinone/menaquinone biosynthesis C-methylase UbiE
MKKISTGERLDNFQMNETILEHLHRYALTLELITDKDILDIASGEGYGSNLMAKKAKSVVGVDLSAEAVSAAKTKYQRPNLNFKIGDATQLDFENGSFDVVVSFETIEHHDQHEKMLSEIKRILKPDGILIISTPDKLRYTDIPKYNNPFHIKELYAEEFKSLIAQYFDHHVFIGQRFDYCSFLFSEDVNLINGTYSGDTKTVSSIDDWGPVYWIAIASATALPQLNINAFYPGNFIIDLKLEALKKSWQYKVGSLIVDTAFFRFILRTRDFFRGKK